MGKKINTNKTTAKGLVVKSILCDMKQIKEMEKLGRILNTDSFSHIARFLIERGIEHVKKYGVMQKRLSA